jgi:hypothetical protein
MHAWGGGRAQGQQATAWSQGTRRKEGRKEEEEEEEEEEGGGRDMPEGGSSTTAPSRHHAERSKDPDPQPPSARVVEAGTQEQGLGPVHAGGVRQRGNPARGDPDTRPRPRRTVEVRVVGPKDQGIVHDKARTLGRGVCDDILPQRVGKGRTRRHTKKACTRAHNHHTLRSTSSTHLENSNRALLRRSTPSTKEYVRSALSSCSPPPPMQGTGRVGRGCATLRHSQAHKQRGTQDTHAHKHTSTQGTYDTHVHTHAHCTQAHTKTRT